ncbi:hypothetical protein ACFSCX_23645 [Bacillus salitolerans]|uniref:ATP-dependent Lon protease n=1 Tax=Bacillus salitolerans TaxID=1437434 RepID=A0ABW4LZA8_9BACI
MYLLLSIILSTLLGYLLIVIHPLVGGVIAFGIIAGVLFRGLYLLNSINNRLVKSYPKTDKVQDAYEQYLSEKEKGSS